MESFNIHDRMEVGGIMAFMQRGFKTQQNIYDGVFCKNNGF